MQNLKSLQTRVNTLEKENKKLKKQVSQYKKYVTKSANIILDNYENSIENHCLVEQRVKTKVCEECGKGDLKEVQILDLSFEICQLCKYRKKIK